MEQSCREVMPTLGINHFIVNTGARKKLSVFFGVLNEFSDISRAFCSRDEPDMGDMHPAWLNVSMHDDADDQPLVLQYPKEIFNRGIRTHTRP